MLCNATKAADYIWPSMRQEGNARICIELQLSFVFPHIQVQSTYDNITNLTMEMCKIAISYNLSKAVHSSSNITHNLGDLADVALDYLESHATPYCCDAVLALKMKYCYIVTCTRLAIVMCMNIISDPV